MTTNVESVSVTDIIETYEALIARARRAGMRPVDAQKAWAKEATVVLLGGAQICSGAQS